MKRIKIIQVNKLHFCIWKIQKRRRKKTSTGDNVKNGAERKIKTNTPTNKVHRFYEHGERRAKERKTVKRGYPMILMRHIWDKTLQIRRMTTVRYAFFLFALSVFCSFLLIFNFFLFLTFALANCIPVEMTLRFFFILLKAEHRIHTYILYTSACMENNYYTAQTDKTEMTDWDVKWNEQNVVNETTKATLL